MRSPFRRPQDSSPGTSPPTSEYPTFKILKELLKLFVRENSHSTVDPYDLAWTLYALRHMKISDEVPIKFGDQISKASVTSNYLQAVSALLFNKLQNKKDADLISRTKKAYPLSEIGDMNGEVLAGLLISDPDDAELKDRAKTVLNQREDITKTLNVLAAMKLESVEIDSVQLANAESWVLSQLGYLKEFGNASLMALAIIALKGKDIDSFVSALLSKLDNDIINPFLKASVGLAQISSISQMMKEYAVPRDVINRSESNTGYLVKMEENKLVLSLDESEEAIQTDLRFLNVRPSFIAKTLLALYVSGTSYGYMISEKEKTEYFDKFQEVRQGKSVTVRRTVLIGTGVAAIAVGLLTLLGVIFPQAQKIPYIEYWSVALPVALIYAGLSAFSYAYRGKEAVTSAINSLKSVIHS